MKRLQLGIILMLFLTFIGLSVFADPLVSPPAKNPNGINNAPKFSGDLLDWYPSVDPTRLNVFMEDFFVYTAADWTLEDTGSPTETLAVPTADFGSSLLLTNGSSDNDYDLVSTGEVFLLESDKQAWLEIKFKTDDATASDIIVGLSVDSITRPLTSDITSNATEGAIYFAKDAGDANIDFHVMKDGTATDATAIDVLADDTGITLGFYFDGNSTIEYYGDGVHLGSVASTNLPNDEALAIVFGIQNGAAAAKTMNIEYVFAAQER